MNMLAGLCLLILAQQTPASMPAASDIRAGELLQRAVVISSIDPEDDEDFSDLEPLKGLIGDSRLVVLGEQSHGDGAVFLAKARLIKFLHQEMGFDVLTWESGMFECREVDRAMKDPTVSMEDIGRMGIFAIWTASAQVRPTLDCVRATQTTAHPIETAGFDHQFSGGDTANRAAAMIAFFDKADPSMLTPAMREDITGGFAKFNERGPDGLPNSESIEPLIAKWSAVGELMDQQREALMKAHGEAEFDFMRRVADDAVVSARSMLEFIAGRGKMKVTDNNTRDARMAENLVWQVNERYKDRKIIAWMATMHGVNDIQRIKPLMGPPIYEGVTNCGTLAKKSLGATMYTVGFTAFDGKPGNVWARTEPIALPPPTPGSIEDLCGQTGKQFLFIDFRSLPADHWLRQPMLSRPLGYGEMVATEGGWPVQMDAMFFTRTMFPSTRANALPPYAVLREE